MIDLKDVIEIHNLVIRKSGGLDDGYDKALLDSSISSVFQSCFGRELYPTIEEKSARLAFNIIKNHPFSDGNKRTGLMLMLSYLEFNKISLIYSDSDLIKFGIGVADSSIDYNNILNWIDAHKINQ